MKVYSEETNIPELEPLPQDNKETHTSWSVLMRFSNRNLSPNERIFNYSLSRSTRVVEHALRVLAKCLQILSITLRKKQCKTLLQPLHLHVVL